MDTDQKLCHWCGRSEDAHEADPRPYKALMGEHDYQPAVYEPPVAAPDRPRERPCTCATSETPAQHHCGPSAQLPPRREDTERARDWPAYQTGRAPASNPTAYVNQQLQQTPEEFRQTADAAKALGDQIPPQKRRP